MVLPPRVIRTADTGVSYISLFDASTFPVKIAAEVKDFDESTIILPEDMEHFASRATKLCVAATQEATESESIQLDKIQDQSSLLEELLQK